MGKVAPTLALYGQASDLLSDMCENWCLTRVSMGLDDGRAAVWLVRHGLAKWADGHHREWVEPTTEGRAAAALLRAEWCDALNRGAALPSRASVSTNEGGEENG